MATPRPSPLYLDGKGRRRQGQTRNEYVGVSLHRGTLKQRQKAKSPSLEEINAPPKDSSDEEDVTQGKEGSTITDSGGENGRNERTRSPNIESENLGDGVHGNANSEAAPKTHTSSSQLGSQKRSSDELDDMLYMWAPTASKRPKTGMKPRQLKYGYSQKTTVNIHSPPVEPLGRPSQRILGNNNAGNAKQGKKRFNVPPGDSSKKRVSEPEYQVKAPKFKAIPKGSTSPPSPSHLQDSVKSSSRPTFNAPKCLTLKEDTTTRPKRGLAFRSFGASSRSRRSSQSPTMPLTCAGANTAPTNSQYQHAVHVVADKLGMNSKENTDISLSSSNAAATHPTSSFEQDSNSSGLSTPPDSPTKARCPLCKKLVEKDWFEKVTGCKRLTVRQQSEFCKSHQIKSARDHWQQRDYPNIQWSTFDQRLKTYHRTIEDILQGSKPSFYRNALEDSLKTGKNRTLKQTMMQGHTFEGLLPGYYGSRGAKMMVDNIIARFASKLRRLGGSDKIISSSGVSGYVQAVLAPELAVLLVMDDMKTDEDGAREVLRDSVDIGNLLNEEEDEAVHWKSLAEDDG
ncbi:MAG: hypothetical protein Q9217_005146 [Psora testacea]